MAETSPFMTMLQSIPLLITLQERLFQNRIYPLMTYMTYIWYIDICDILLIQGFWHPSRHRPGAWYNNNKLVEFFCFYLIIAIMEKLVNILCFYFINIYLGKKGWLMVLVGVAVGLVVSSLLVFTLYRQRWYIRWSIFLYECILYV